MRRRAPLGGAALVLLFVPGVAYAQTPHLELDAPTLGEAAPDPPADFAEARPFTLELAHGFGGVPVRANAEPTFSFGMGLSYRVHEHVALGVGSILIGFGGSSDGPYVSVRALPHVELFAFVDPRVQLYAQIGARIFGDTSTSFAPGGVDVALAARAGARFWLTEFLTIGVEIGIDVVLTESMRFGSSYLPQGSVVGNVGLTLGFHF
jgi:hypothetical protein